MSKPDKLHQLTREDFRNDRAKVFELASSGQQVIITNENQRPTAIVATPRDKKPMRFD